ncbi:MAG: glycosyltransferase family 1 protein, partial [Chloroflexi bacterium]|nr:glycosyltransferase family 1 protein [Chloroflexota bacterium]
MSTGAQHISILALGSRGDTQPYLPLARGLQQAGHSVQVVAGDEFADFVTGYGLDYAPAGINFRAFVNDHMLAALESGQNTLRAVREIFREGAHYVGVMNERVRAACQGTDVIITGLVGALMFHHFAEHAHIPLIYALTIPLP